jgi:hypothetical protein
MLSLLFGGWLATALIPFSIRENSYFPGLFGRVARKTLENTASPSGLHRVVQKNVIKTVI